MEFTELPIVNMFDLTKQSSNFIKCKKGEVKHPHDLECNIIVDDKLAQEDLHVIEQEVNKANRKRLKDLKNNALIPAANRTSM